jgi:hypothetical protein
MGFVERIRGHSKTSMGAHYDKTHSSTKELSLSVSARAMR